MLFRFARRLMRFTFHDEVRLLELFSAANLIAWSKVLLTAPELAQHGVYKGFGPSEAVLYAYCFGLISLFQFGAVLARRWRPSELRFAAMAFAAGAWTVIAWNFWQTGLSTPANLNYTFLALTCAVSGAYLGWKTTSYQS